MTPRLIDALSAAATTNGAIRHRFVGSERDLSLTTTGLLADGHRFAAVLRSLGMTPGEPLAVQLPNWPEFVVSFLAALELELLFVPIVHGAGPAEVAFILEQSRARVLVVAGEVAGVRPSTSLHESGRGTELQHVIAVGGPRLSNQLQWTELLASAEHAPSGQARARRDPESPAFVLYTSGSTADPKGVLHSEASIGATVRRWIDRSAPADGDAVLMHLPVGHVGGVLFASRLFLHPARMIFLEHWRPDVAARLVADERVTAMPATPFHLDTLFHAAARLGTSLDSLASVGLSSTAIPPAVVEAASARGIAAFRGYGSTEHPVVAWGRPSDPLEMRVHSDGRLMPDAEVRVVGEDDEQVPNGTIGEILSRGPGLMSGYLDQRLNGDVLVGGWYRSGDLGHVTDDGVLTVTGRKKDVIIRGGENISAKEIEDVLVRHPDVADVAILGLPDERYGERVLAVVVARGSSLTLQTLVLHIAEAGMARSKQPDALAVVPELPRTSVGKINKEQLRRAIRSGELHVETR